MRPSSRASVCECSSARVKALVSFCRMTGLLARSQFSEMQSRWPVPSVRETRAAKIRDGIFERAQSK